MKPRFKKWIERWLNRFPEVKWDRWGGDDGRAVVYGWLEREDGRSDFMLVDFRQVSGGVDVFYITSSERFSEPFASRLGAPHRDCKRVEKDFGGVENVVRLRKKR